MRFETAPVVESDWLRLRPVDQADVAAWYAYLAIPATVAHTSWNLAGPDDLVRLIEACDSTGPESAIRFAVVERRSDSLVGTAGFHTISPLNGTAEIAYDVAPAYWGRGVASAVCRALVAWGFAQRGLVRIQATALVSNAPSIRVLEKCGFAHEGTLRNYRRVRGVPSDFHMYAILAGNGPTPASTPAHRFRPPTA